MQQTMKMTGLTQTWEARTTSTEPKPRTSERREALVASGALRIKDERLIYPPTGRHYAD